MKIKLWFESIDEFVIFLLSASSLRVDSVYFREHVSKNGIASFNFFDSFKEIEVEGVGTYHVQMLMSDTKPNHSAEFFLCNFMGNQNQVEADSVHLEFAKARRINVRGHVSVTEYFAKNIPHQFILRIGLRKEYCEFLFQIKE